MTIIKVEPEYTEREAADLLGIQPQSLRAQRSRGSGMPYIKRGTRVFYRQSDVHDRIKGQLVMPGK